MGIQGGGSGRSVFLRGQQFFQFRKLGSPRRFVRVKGICQATPANIAGQYLLLLRRGLPGGLLQMLQQLNRCHIGLVLGLGAALTQMVVTDMEILGVAAQVVFVLLVGRLLSRPLTGEGLPLTVYRDGDLRPRFCICLHFRGGHGFLRRGFRLINVQPFHYHVVGQVILVAGVDLNRLGCDFRRRGFFFPRRKQSGVALILAQPGFKLFPADDIIAPSIRPGVNADRCIFNGINRAGDGMIGRRERHMVAHLVRRGAFQEGRVQPVRKGFGFFPCFKGLVYIIQIIIAPRLLVADNEGFFKRIRCFLYRIPLKAVWVLEEAVLLMHIQSPQKRHKFIPAVCQGRKFSSLIVQDLHLNAGGEGAVVRYIPGHKVHRLHAPGIQLGKAFGDFGVALAIPQPAGNVLLILPGKQAGSQHFPQVLVRFLRVGKKELGNGAVSQVVFQQLLEPFPVFGPEDWVSHAGRKKLYGIRPQFCDLVFLIVQIDRVALMVDRRGWVIDLFLRNSLLDGFIFLVRHGNVHLVGGFAATDGEGVSLAGDGLAGQIGQRNLRLRGLIRVVAKNAQVGPLF